MLDVMAPLFGGLLIGLAVAMLLLLDGRVAGISGIVGIPDLLQDPVTVG